MPILYPISIIFLSLFTYNNNKINEIKSIENKKIKEITDLKNEVKSIENEFIQNLNNNNLLLEFPNINIKPDDIILINMYSLYLVKIMNFAKINQLSFKYEKINRDEILELKVSEIKNIISKKLMINYYELVIKEIDFVNKKIYLSSFLND